MRVRFVQRGQLYNGSIDFIQDTHTSSSSTVASKSVDDPGKFGSCSIRKLP